MSDAKACDIGRAIESKREGSSDVREQLRVCAETGRPAVILDPSPTPVVLT